MLLQKKYLVCSADRDQRRLCFLRQVRPAGPAPIKHSQKIPLLAGEAGQGALGAGHPAGLAFSADGSAPVRQRQKMNNIRNAAMEIVSTDLIYA